MDRPPRCREQDRPDQLPDWLLRLRHDVDCTPGPLESAVRSAVSRYAALVIGEMDKLPASEAGFFLDRLDLLGPAGQ